MFVEVEQALRISQALTHAFSPMKQIQINIKTQNFPIFKHFMNDCCTMTYLGFNYKPSPYLFLACFHHTLQNGQPKTPDYVHYFKKKPVFSTDHLHQNILRLEYVQLHKHT